MENAESPDLALEREKIQIERERLALERERWETERKSYRHTVDLSNRAAGRLTIPVSTLILSLIIANLLGVIISLWFVSRPRGDSEEIAATLAQALDAGGDFPDSTNGTHSARSPLIRALNRKGRTGGYLLILD
jgi:hypothetical protein